MTNDPNYGPRYGGAGEKGSGYFGPLTNSVGDVVTEYGVGVEINGVETEIPSIVPTLTASQLQAVLDASASDSPPPQDVIQAATDYAEQRIAQGLSPFAQPGEQQAPPKKPDLDLFIKLTSPTTGAPGWFSDIAHLEENWIHQTSPWTGARWEDGGGAVQVIRSGSDVIRQFANLKVPKKPEEDRKRPDVLNPNTALILQSVRIAGTPVDHSRPPIGPAESLGGPEKIGQGLVIIPQSALVARRKITGDYDWYSFLGDAMQFGPTMVYAIPNPQLVYTQDDLLNAPPNGLPQDVYELQGFDINDDHQLSGVMPIVNGKMAQGLIQTDPGTPYVVDAFHVQGPTNGIHPYDGEPYSAYTEISVTPIAASNGAFVFVTIKAETNAGGDDVSVPDDLPTWESIDFPDPQVVINEHDDSVTVADPIVYGFYQYNSFYWVAWAKIPPNSMIPLTTRLRHSALTDLGGVPAIDFFSVVIWQIDLPADKTLEIPSDGFFKTASPGTIDDPSYSQMVMVSGLIDHISAGAVVGIAQFQPGGGTNWRAFCQKLKLV